MDGLDTAEQVAQVLAVVAGFTEPHQERLTPNLALDPDEVAADPFSALLRDQWPRMAAARQARLVNDARNAGIRLDLPPALGFQGGLGRLYVDEGEHQTLVQHLHASTTRPRIGVLADPRGAARTPVGSWARCVSILAARATADLLDAWSPDLRAGEARKVRGEARTYREYATAAEERLRQSVETWLPRVLRAYGPVTRPAPVIAAQPYGYAQVGPA